MLAGRTGNENIVVRGARLLDPAEGLDATLDIRIDNGVIVQLGEQLDTNEHRVVDAPGLIVTPAFIDPHVHLRTPGREDEETIASGTAAAAAGAAGRRHRLGASGRAGDRRRAGRASANRHGQRDRHLDP